MSMTPSLALVVAFATAAPTSLPAPPVTPVTVTDARFAVELVASAPQIVTPIGITVDAKGRLYVVESHTHLPLADYVGPKHDVIKRFEDRDGDGRFETVGVFADRPAPDDARRAGPRRPPLRSPARRRAALEGRDGDGRAETRIPILTLETAEVFPHNGLGSVGLGPDGWLYVGMGENMGRPWTLRGPE